MPEIGSVFYRYSHFFPKAAMTYLPENSPASPAGKQSCISQHRIRVENLQ
jgi:hypothetical protein